MVIIMSLTSKPTDNQLYRFLLTIFYDGDKMLNVTRISHGVWQRLSDLDGTVGFP